MGVFSSIFGGKPGAFSILGLAAGTRTRSNCKLVQLPARAVDRGAIESDPIGISALQELWLLLRGRAR
eukprot:6993201-Prorocentrum_lima.AAC.1